MTDSSLPGRDPLPDPTRPPIPDPMPDPAPGPEPAPAPLPGEGPTARAGVLQHRGQVQTGRSHTAQSQASQLYAAQRHAPLAAQPYAASPHVMQPRAPQPLISRPHTPAETIPDPAIVGMDAIGHALRKGWRDFRRAPGFGLFFSAFYVAGGLVLSAVAAAVGQDWWMIPFVVGFPLIAPFAAVGLYEVSRRIEAGEPLDWPSVLGVVFAQKDRQVPSMAMVILLMFMFWVFVAHTTFAMFMGLSALTNITTSPEVLLQGRGLAMLALGTVIGSGFAAVLFSMTVVGLPLILDREVDFISAIIASFAAVAANPGVMLAWAAIIAALLFLGITPLFLGLLVALPVLGHASWHMYRELMPDED